MATRQVRKIVRIDEDKCDGCGLCAPSCAEGAIKIIDGKARLLAENLCDGLGACLGECPRGAITIEERSAAEFGLKDEGAKAREGEGAKGREGNSCPAAVSPARPVSPSPLPHHSGCPGSMLRTFAPSPRRPVAPSLHLPVAAGPGTSPASKLRQWPIQLTLLPTQGPIWQDADVLLAADCVAFAMPDFHERFVGGRTLAIACPKLDDGAAYVEKLAEIFAGNAIRSITVAHMEVPCCFGLERIVRLALAQAGKDLPVSTIKVGIRGAVMGTGG